AKRARLPQAHRSGEAARPVVSLGFPVSSGESTVFAIIQTSGRQYRVEPGAVIEILGHGSGGAGAELTFDQVLVVGKDAGELMAGAPFVSGAKVLGVVARSLRGPKVRIFKKK